MYIHLTTSDQSQYGVFISSKLRTYDVHLATQPVNYIYYYIMDGNQRLHTLIYGTAKRHIQSSLCWITSYYLGGTQEEDGQSMDLF